MESLIFKNSVKSTLFLKNLVIKKIHIFVTKILSNELFLNRTLSDRINSCKWVIIFSASQCGNCRNSLSHFFRKNFVKAMILYTTVWKSKVKCDHVQKFSVKIHTWILPKEVRERISAISTLWRTKWMVFFLFGALLGYLD